MTLQVRLRHRLGDFTLDAAFSAPGGITALFGPSGAGKSSVVTAVAGLVRPVEGRVVVGERVVLDTAAGLFVPPQRRRMGLVFQDARLFPHLTVKDNLLFGWRRAATPATPGEIDAIIALLGLEALLVRSPRHLSGGEKARVALGRALLASPDMLLLDEPLAALDSGRRAEILPYLERLRGRIPMLYVSHVLEEVARLADHVVLLGRGRVTAAGPVFDLLTGLGNPAGVVLGALIDAMALGPREDGLAAFAFPGGVLAAPVAADKGTRVRLRIAAEDILIALAPPDAISANNVLPVTVSNLAFSDQVADVGLAAGDTRMVARITAASARRLGLAAGLHAFAIVKSMTVGMPAKAVP